MNIIKYSLITLFIGMVIFLSIGMLAPTFTYESEVIVDAPKSLAWEIFTNKEKMKDWMLDLEEVKVIDQKDQMVGTVVEFRFLQNDEEITVTEKITEYKEEDKYAFDLSAEVLTANTNISFDSLKSSTRIRVVTQVNPKGFITKSLFFLMKSAFKEQSDIQYNRLKLLIEKSKGHD